MGLGDIFTALWGYLKQFGSWVQVELNAVIVWLGGLLTTLETFFSGIWSKISSVARTLWNHLRALKLGSWSSIWKTLKKLYARYQAWLAWYQKHVQAPLDKIRQTLDQIYDTFFAPIIRFLDALRAPLRILAIFDQKLAARLDNALFKLEDRIMAPLLALYRRVNQLSSYFRAIITQLGFLDQAMLVASVQKNAKLIWQVLVDPRGVIQPAGKSPPPVSIRQVQSDFQDAILRGTGPTQDAVDQATVVFKETLVELS